MKVESKLFDWSKTQLLMFQQMGSSVIRSLNLRRLYNVFTIMDRLCMKHNKLAAAQSMGKRSQAINMVVSII